MRQTAQDAGLALVALAVLAYSHLGIGQTLFRFVTAAGLTVSYGSWRRGQSEEAVVLGVLWGFVAAAAWTARVELILPTVAATALLYLGWQAVDGRGGLPI